MSATQLEPRWRLVVLAGGDSAEREVSLRSGAAVASALISAGHRVSQIDPAKSPLDTVDWSGFDACFIALHGGAGEDGRVQQELQTLGIPYTGSSPLACRLAMSKAASKAAFLAAGVPTPPFLRIEADEPADRIAERVASLGYPLIIKPDGQGSSIGLSLVEQPSVLARAIELARRDDPTCIAESFVRGREFTVAVLDNHALPPIEIVTPERVFSYDAKYSSSLTEYRFDFELADGRREELLHAAVAASEALGTSALVRVDVMLDHDGRVWVLEVNTIPGLTPRSLAPRAAARAGLDMAALCELLVRQCLATSDCSSV
jgi:D-alanine-D-alanine ligase